MDQMADLELKLTELANENQHLHSAVQGADELRTNFSGLES